MACPRLRPNSVAPLGIRKHHHRATSSPWLKEVPLVWRKPGSPRLDTKVGAWWLRLSFLVIPRLAATPLWQCRRYSSLTGTPCFCPLISSCDRIQSHASLHVSSVKLSHFWSILTNSRPALLHYVIIVLALINIWNYSVCFLSFIFSSLVCKFFIFKVHNLGYVTDFRERWRERGTLIDCLPYTPWPGIRFAAFFVMWNGAVTNWATRPGQYINFFEQCLCFFHYWILSWE